MVKRKRGEVHAVARGRNVGIFFDWESAARELSGVPNALSKSWSSIAAAERYLKSHGLVPLHDSAGFIDSKSRDPILFRHVTSCSINSCKRQTSNSNKEAQLKKSQVEWSTLTEGTFGTSNQAGVDRQLDTLQQRALDCFLSGSNLFLTGVAGTGKSFVTKLIHDQAIQKYGKGGVALCAPTGVAAVSLGLNGQTIHTLAGIKVPQRVSDFSFMFNSSIKKRWTCLECLIIDEVGMLQGDFLDWLDITVRHIRRRPLEAFGGIQLCFVGDFAQLGPVPGDLSLKNKPPFQPGDEEAECLLNIRECTAYSFQSVCWREAAFYHVQLRRVYRQNDQEFVKALLEIREQRPYSPLVQKLVQKCSTPLMDRDGLQIPDGILPTCLYTTNRDADAENNGMFHYVACRIFYASFANGTHILVKSYESR